MYFESCSRRNSVIRSIDRSSDFLFRFGSGLSGPLRDRIEDELLSSNSLSADAWRNVRLRAAWQDFVAGWDGGRVFFALWAYERWQQALQTPRVRGLRCEIVLPARNSKIIP